MVVAWLIKLTERSYSEKLDSEDPNDDAEAVDHLDDETVMSPPEDTSVLSPTSAADAGGSPIDVKPDVFKKSIVGGHRGEALYKRGGLVKKTISVAGLHMISCAYIRTSIASISLTFLSQTTIPSMSKMDACLLPLRRLSSRRWTSIHASWKPASSGILRM